MEPLSSSGVSFEFFKRNHIGILESLLYLQVVTKIVKSLTNSHTFTCIESFEKLDYGSLIFTRNQYRLSRRKLFIKFAKFNQISHKQPFNSIQVTAKFNQISHKQPFNSIQVTALILDLRLTVLVDS